jgi:hypothetical protein
MTTATTVTNDSKDWMRFLRNHWYILVLFIIGVVSAAVGAVYVFLWYTANAQASSLVPKTLALWTMGNVLTFILNLVFWELVLVGVPVIIVAVVGWMWWRRLPDGKKSEYHISDSRPRSTSGSSGIFSVLFWIAFSIRVYFEGNWNVPVSTWTLDYFVYTGAWTLIWMLVIFGIPASVIGILWWISHERTRKRTLNP